ncbi:MAG: hypothetical protein ACXADF_16150 [Candidatus Thorarchaeota archaeon]
MSEDTKKLYTPFVLRTGFMHSYRRTLPLLGLTILLEFVFWTLGNFWPRFSELGAHSHLYSNLTGWSMGDKTHRL